MTRIKNGSIRWKRHKKIVKFNKGFKGSNSKLFKAAQQKYMKALRYSYFDRRKKKNEFRKIWIQRINITCKLNNLYYNKLINQLKMKKSSLNKKILSKIAISDIETFKQIITKTL